MPSIGSDSPPCPERCPKCGQRCFGRQGHSFIKTAGRHYAHPHACRQHFWGTSSEWIEVQRSEGRESRREVRESIQKCGKCLQIVERLG